MPANRAWVALDGVITAQIIRENPLVIASSGSFVEDCPYPSIVTRGTPVALEQPARLVEDPVSRINNC